MSVNISVSGNTLKECHDQIVALAKEIVINETPVVTSIHNRVVSTELPITPEVASVPVQHVATHNATTAVTPNTVAQSSDVDSRGLPWDARIHSSNREKGNTGVWRRRRGVSEEIEAQVEAELFGKVPAKKVASFGSMVAEQYKEIVTQVPPTMPTTEVIAKLPETANVLAAAQLPPAAPVTFAPPAHQQVLPPNTHNADSFRNNLVIILNDLAAAGKINHQWINDQKTMFGGKDVVQWHENQAACAQLFEAFVGWKLINRL